MINALRLPLLIVLLELSGCLAMKRVTTCSFTDTANTWRTSDSCIQFDESGVQTAAPEILSQLDFDPINNLAPIYLGDGWAYISTSGKIVVRRIASYENGPEPFKDDLLRVQIDDKYGFFDPTGEIAIPAQYDGAMPFDQGYTSVCTGCTVESNGDYHEFSGGLWSCIDTTGKKVPEKFCESE